MSANLPIPLELSVRRVNFPNQTLYGGMLSLTPSTPDARNWIEQEAPRFGRLFHPEPRGDSYKLFISEVYRTNDVEAYLRDGYATP